MAFGEDRTFSTTMALKIQADSDLKLIAVEGSCKGQSFFINKTSVIGSDPDADVYVEDPLICPRHARFYKEGNWWLVKDMLSENGTFINDKLVKNKPVFPNCRLALGNTRFIIEYVNEPHLETVIVQRKGEWVELPSIIAHELKNYLQFLDAGFEQLKANSSFQDQYKDELSSLEIAGERMQELVQILRTGYAELNLTEVNFVDLVWEQIAMIEHAAQAAGILLEVSLPDKSIPIQVDERQMGSCLLNILKNAFEACEKGNMISVMLTHESSHYMNFIVRDTGRGMNKKTLESMWNPMFTTRDTGNGLGAFIARTIVIRHGGRISAESVQGKGTVIRIELPKTAK